FFEMLLRYLRYTLFSYTALFRSTKRALIPAIACLFLLFFGGRWLFFTPTATISMDINPSIELNVNRFNQVIGVQSYNDDGEKLLDRKSTRLNSSHVSISYAVFCL